MKYYLAYNITFENIGEISRDTRFLRVIKPYGNWTEDRKEAVLMTKEFWEKEIARVGYSDTWLVKGPVELKTYQPVKRRIDADRIN